MSGEPDVVSERTRPRFGRVVAVILSVSTFVVGVWAVAMRSPAFPLQIPASIDLGFLEPGSTVAVQIPIDNTSSGPVRCIGIPSRCDLGCFEASSIPFTIAPSTTHTAVMSFHAPTWESLKYRGITETALVDKVELFFDLDMSPHHEVELYYTLQPVAASPPSN